MNARWLPPVAIGLLSAGQPICLSAQSPPHPFQATDYYRLTTLSDPRVSPDGRRIAFVVSTVVEDKDRRHSEIWTVPTDGSAPAFRYTSPATEASNPVWSPDGSLLAITSGPDPRRFDGRVYTSLPFLEDERGLVPPRETRRPSHLYLVPRGGGEPKQLTSGDLSQRAPDWSPDGRAIVFLQDSTDTSEVRDQVRPQLYVLTVADGAVRRLATPYVENVEPAWSPDGNSIAFICSKGRGAENDVCVVPAASGGGGGGGAIRNLTGAWDLDPASPFWSADSKTVYFRA